MRSCNLAFEDMPTTKRSGHFAVKTALTLQFSTKKLPHGRKAEKKLCSTWTISTAATDMLLNLEVVILQEHICIFVKL